MAGPIQRLISWYRTPIGLISIVCIVAVVVLVVIERNGFALVVVTAWIALALPHKLMNERRDWAAAIDARTRAFDEKLAELSDRLDAVAHEQRRAMSDISQTPTVEEINTWQQSVEAAQAATNAALSDMVDELRGGIAGGHDDA